MGYYDITVVSINDKAKTKLTSYIQEVDGKIIKQVEIGTKSLIYPIKKQKEGYFNAIVIECEAEKIKSLSDAISIDKETLRHLIIKSDAKGSTLTYGEKLQDSERQVTKEAEIVKPKKIEIKLEEKPIEEIKTKPEKKEEEKPVKKEVKISKKVYVEELKVNAEELRRSKENKKTLDEKLDEILKG